MDIETIRRLADFFAAAARAALEERQRQTDRLYKRIAELMGARRELQEVPRGEAAVREGFDAPWIQATGRKSPDAARDCIVHLEQQVKRLTRARDEAERRGHALAEDWMRATGCETPGEAKAAFDAARAVLQGWWRKPRRAELEGSGPHETE